MEFPPSWVVESSAAYYSSTPALVGDFTVELFAQLRSSGRLLDGFRLALDGTKPLEIQVDLVRILPVEQVRGWQLSQQAWPRDLMLRQNMLSTAWVSITETVTSNDVDLVDQSGAGLSPAAFMRSLTQLPDTGPVNASTRWAVVVGSDGFLKLQWQSLPLVASVLNSRSVFKRYSLKLLYIQRSIRNHVVDFKFA